MRDIHIIITEDALILVRNGRATFRDFQDAYPDFKTSLGPMDRDELLAFVAEEWPDHLALNGDALRAFTAPATEHLEPVLHLQNPSERPPTR